jgi:mono/diheme cytochrome c family protein
LSKLAIGSYYYPTLESAAAVRSAGSKALGNEALINTVNILSFYLRNLTSNLRNRLCLFLAVSAALTALTACDVERRKSDAELGLNPQQAAGRKLYDNYCDRCHEPYSSRGKKGPSMKGMFKRQYLPLSGLPANDERMTDIVKYGRSKMEGFGQVMTDQQIKDLIAYMHTL